MSESDEDVKIIETTVELVDVKDSDSESSSSSSSDEEDEIPVKMKPPINNNYEKSIVEIKDSDEEQEDEVMIIDNAAEQTPIDNAAIPVAATAEDNEHKILIIDNAAEQITIDNAAIPAAEDNEHEMEHQPNLCGLAEQDNSKVDVVTDVQINSDEVRESEAVVENTDVKAETTTNVPHNDEHTDQPEEDEAIFELTFKRKENFQKIGFSLMNTLKDALKKILPDKNVKIQLLNTSTGQIVLRAVEQQGEIDESATNSEEDECKTMAVEEALTLETVAAVTSNVEDKTSASTSECGINELTANTDITAAITPRSPSPDYTGIEQLFYIDNEAKDFKKSEVPSYKRSYKTALGSEDATSSKRQKLNPAAPKRQLKHACFNCGSYEHSMRDCTERRNEQNIQRAKKQHSANQISNERYHKEAACIYGDKVPGDLSEDLKDALGLGRRELPGYIYKMRLLGYPPGWLAEAKGEESGLVLFNGEGNVVEDENNASVKYDAADIYDFPGYNSFPGKKMHDDHRHYMVPPLTKKQSKHHFLKQLGKHVNQGYTRKKLNDFSKDSVSMEVDKNSANCDVAEMEIADESEPLVMVPLEPPLPMDIPTAELMPAPPPPPLWSPSEKEHSTVIIEEQLDELADETLSAIPLAVLEEERRHLLSEMDLLNCSSASNEDIPESTEVSENLSPSKDKDEQPSCSVTQTESTEQSLEFDKSTETPKTPSTDTSQNLTTSSAKLTCLGTPLLKFSEYDNLPNCENFKVGVSDVILFENLPESTGKYEEKIKGVIAKVRKFRKKQDEKEKVE